MQITEEQPSLSNSPTNEYISNNFYLWQRIKNIVNIYKIKFQMTQNFYTKQFFQFSLVHQLNYAMIILEITLFRK